METQEWIVVGHFDGDELCGKPFVIKAEDLEAERQEASRASGDNIGVGVLATFNTVIPV